MDRLKSVSTPILLAILIFSLLCETSSWLPLAWDEGDCRFRARQALNWLESIPNRPWCESFNQEEIRNSWRYIDHKEGHPAFYGWVTVAGMAIRQFTGLGDERTAFLFFYAAAIAAVYAKLRRHFPDQTLVRWFTVFALIAIPRLYCHAHFSVNDSILTSCWLLSWATFTDTDKPKWSLAPTLFGLFLGLTMGTKFTGFLAVPCFAVAALMCPNRYMIAWLTRSFLTAAVVFYLINPPMWFAPWESFSQFIYLNTHRSEQFNLTGCFFGSLYNMNNSLPPWNTIVWIAITVPTGILLCFAMGLRSVITSLCRRKDVLFITVLMCNFLVLPIVRALPHTPAHDNERLFITSFAFLAIIAGIGASALSQWRWDRRPVGLIALILIVIGSGSSWLVYGPSWLSYYNLVIGGLPGAYRCGMEPTYWWTDLDTQTLEWLNSNTPVGDKVRFQATSWYNLNLLIQEKKLRKNYHHSCPGQYRWYVMQTRWSVMKDSDRQRLAEQTPVYVKSIPFAGWGPWNLKSVPLICVFEEQTIHEPFSRLNHRGNQNGL